MLARNNIKSQFLIFQLSCTMKDGEDRLEKKMENSNPSSNTSLKWHKHGIDLKSWPASKFKALSGRTPFAPGIRTAP